MKLLKPYKVTCIPFLSSKNKKVFLVYIAIKIPIFQLPKKKLKEKENNNTEEEANNCFYGWTCRSKPSWGQIIVLSL